MTKGEENKKVAEIFVGAFRSPSFAVALLTGLVALATKYEYEQEVMA